MTRIALPEVVRELERVLATLGFTPDRAARSARLFAEASLDGVASHGLNRFPRFVRQVKEGYVDVHAEPALVEAFGALERWDGRRGPGNLNAQACTDRAVELARAHGLGGVALANTNHWMRGGAYAWQAVAAGCAFVAWTNTTPNMPPWGGTAPRLGNNPLIVAVPRDGAPVVVDVAMSLYSYGRMEVAQLRGQPLPYPGGFDRAGALTTDPAAILESQRPLPIGYWKGSSLSLVLDLLGAVLSGGKTTREIGTLPDESDLSQVFLAFDVARIGGLDRASRLVTAVIDDLRAVAPSDPAAPVRYPGEQVLRTRAENLERGIPVDDAVWREIRRL